MPRRLWLSLLHLTLCLSVLGAGVAPLAVRHVHEGGGDLGHEHGRPAFHAREHPEAGHVHLVWLGVEIALPASPISDDDDHDDELGSVELVFLPQLDMQGPIADSGVAWARPLPPPGLPSGCALPRAVSAAFAPDADAPRVLLSDTARHARSGVQLI